MPVLLEQCHECAKVITDDEWVVNWGSCDRCFNRHYMRYLLFVQIPKDIWRWILRRGQKIEQVEAQDIGAERT